MKIIMAFTKSNDYTFSIDVIRAIEAESVEAAFCAFDDALKQANNGYFRIFGEDFYTCDFAYENYPTFVSLDEWFEKNKRVLEYKI